MTMNDQSAREAIEFELSKTLFIEAGAGTGKTTSLVGRICSLVTGQNRIPMSQVAAITFTKNAASELKNRVRAKINKRISEVANGSEEEKELHEVLESIDGAAISTLHSFAQRVLDEYPLQAGLPPTFELLDEIAYQIDFAESWDIFFAKLIECADNRDWLILLRRLGVKEKEIRAVTQKLSETWGQLGWEAQSITNLDNQSALIQGVLGQAQSLLRWLDDCAESDTDTLNKKLKLLPELIMELEGCCTDLEQSLVMLNNRYDSLLKSGGGAKDKWGGDRIEEVRSEFNAFSETFKQLHYLIKNYTLDSCIEELRQFALKSAEDRKKSGKLGFYDLLVCCRDLLRLPTHGVQARKSLHRRYSYLLIDEFHDTDPIQIEIASLIATPVSEENESLTTDWKELTPTAGSLFFVGDPKQSIYRFRGADIQLYHEAHEHFGRKLGETHGLNVNFRSSAPLIAWVNHTFSNLMETDPKHLEEKNLQATYAHLSANPDHISAGNGAPIMLLGNEPHGSISKSEVATLEGSDIAGTIVEVLKEKWTVCDKQAEHGIRPARLRDIAILIPSRTHLKSLEKALDKSLIPYRLEAKSFFWENAVIRDLMMCLQAIDDPTNELATVSALRSPIYGCADDDLYFHKVERSGSWNYLKNIEDPIETDLVYLGLTHLKYLHYLSSSLTPAELIEKLVKDRQVFEQATAWPRVREQWRYVRFLVDQARVWSESQQAGLRSFLLWVNQQLDEKAHDTQLVLPELDNDAVRIMTIHASKGLEFPIVIIAALQEKAKKPSRPSEIGFFSNNKPPAVSFAKTARTQNYDEWAKTEALANHFERIRRLYVASTRAKDHLIISLHRADPALKPALHNKMSAELIFDSNFTDEAQLPDGVSIAEEVFDDPEPLSSEHLYLQETTSNRPELEVWEQDRKNALKSSQQTTWLSATKMPEVPDEPHSTSIIDYDERRKGIGGTDFGNAVHHVLERLDLAAAIAAVTGQSDATEFNERLSSLCHASAPEAHKEDWQAEIENRIRALLSHQTVIDAAKARHWHEIYVGAQSEAEDFVKAGIIMYGFVDLLYEDSKDEAGGALGTPPDLVVLDFKTSNTSDDSELKERTVGYLSQGAVYAYCVQKATGRNVSRVEFAYMTPDGTEIQTVEGKDLADAIANVVAKASESASDSPIDHT